jgi:hypothetical protein
MARAATTANTHTGLYAWLLAREDRAVANGGTLSNHDTGTSYDGTPERLACLRAGRPVNIAASDLPRSARADRGTLQWFHRAVVSPGGGVEFVDDNGEWLAEQGL